LNHYIYRDDEEFQDWGPWISCFENVWLCFFWNCTRSL